MAKPKAQTFHGARSAQEPSAPFGFCLVAVQGAVSSKDFATAGHFIRSAWRGCSQALHSLFSIWLYPPTQLLMLID